MDMKHPPFIKKNFNEITLPIAYLGIYILLYTSI